MCRVPSLIGDGLGAAVTHPRHQPPPVDDRGADASDDDRSDDGVQANARLTGMTALVLFLLLAAEGYTIVRVGAHLTLHVVIGMILVAGLVEDRFYELALCALLPRVTGVQAQGAAARLLRLLGPVVVVLTLAVLGSGIALLLGPSSMRQELLLVHKATFILWFGALAIHVLGHFVETMQLRPKISIGGPGVKSEAPANANGHSSARCVSGCYSPSP